MSNVNGSPGVPGRGVDRRPEDRPGVPMEWSPPHLASGAHWREPPGQTETVPIQRYVGGGLTPVFGTMNPPKGLSGIIRRIAYATPDHRPRHWMMLLLADRVDVIESAVVDLFRRRPLFAALAGVGGLALVGRALAARRAT